MSISAWSYGEPVMSPNGKVTANLVDANEIAMGAPTSGTLKLSTGFIFYGCNPSLVWSEDSKFIAVPVWQNNLCQKLGIINVENGELVQYPKIFRVLELSSFRSGIVSGIDSPVYQPTKFELNVNEIISKT